MHIGKLFKTITICAVLNVPRWATNPVVKVAQMEKTVDFPKQLEVPWPYLQRHFGVTADSGNITANILLGFDENGERRYKINVGMSESITASEETFSRMFYDVEVLVCQKTPFGPLLVLAMLTLPGISDIL